MISNKIRTILPILLSVVLVFIGLFYVFCAQLPSLAAEDVSSTTEYTGLELSWGGD